MATRKNLPYIAAGVVATAGALYYVLSSHSNTGSKSRRIIPPVFIETIIPAKDVYLQFRDPGFYLSLTPESQYTVVSSEIQDSGMEYVLHHQVSSSRSVTTKCRRNWVDEIWRFGIPFQS
jgi:hypothetical protein